MSKKFWLFLLALVPLYMTWTFDHSLWNPDETRDAGIASEMYRTGEFAIPKLNGEPFLEKPPLYYWTCVAVYKLTGRVTAGTTRLPSALYGILGVLFTFLIGRRLFNERAGLFAAAILATTSQYFRMSHFAMMDISLAAMVAGALFFYLKGSRVGFAVFTVLAFYAKGFLGVVLPGIVVTLDLLLDKKPKELAKTIAVSALVFLALTLPWFWELWHKGGRKFLEVFFIDNHWKRYTVDTGDHTEHFWFFYLLSFPVDFLLWTPIFFGALRSLSLNIPDHFESRPKRFLWLWFFGLLLFFTVSSSKRSLYLLPLFPAAALLAGTWLDEVIKKESWAYWAFGGVGAAIAFASFLFAGRLDNEKTFVPLCEVIAANRTGKDLVGFDMNEMERGVFSFYLGGPIANVIHAEDLQKMMAQEPSKKFLVLSSKNKRVSMAPLEPDLKLLFEYRPQKKTRSYLLYESTDHRRRQNDKVLHRQGA